MSRLHFCMVTAVAFLSLARLSQADTPLWVQVKQDTQTSLQFPLSDAPESPAHDRLHPDDVFSGSAESLIRMSCSDAEGQCCDGMDGICTPAHTPTWVKFTPYVWATQVKGDLTVDGLTAPMDINLSDLWQMLTDGEVRGGFMGHLGFGRDNWTIFINGDIVSMAPSAEVRRANIETGLTMTLLELGGAVDLFNADESDPANSPLRIQMLGGVRYYAVDAAAIVSLPNINPLIQIENGEIGSICLSAARHLRRSLPIPISTCVGMWADLVSVPPPFMRGTWPQGFLRTVSAAPNCSWDIVCSIWNRASVAALDRLSGLVSIR